MNGQEVKYSNNSSREIEKTSISKVVMLALTAVMLCAFGPLSLFAPIPLVISFLLYGRSWTFFMGALSTALWWYLTFYKALPLPMMTMYLVAFLFAILISEVLFRNINPVKGLMYSGVTSVLILGSSLILFNKYGKLTVKEELHKMVVTATQIVKESNKDVQNSKEAKEIEEFVSKPSEITETIFNLLPALVFIFVYLGLWLSFYWTLRNYKIWRNKVFYTFSLKDLILFKSPEFLIYPLILALAFLVGAEFGLPKVYGVIGGNLVYCLGVIYLFQGFGVYNDFLKFLRIGGFLKALFMIFTLLSANKFLALIGMFDVWFDFRKYLKNSKNDEGDIL